MTRTAMTIPKHTAPFAIASMMGLLLSTSVAAQSFKPGQIQGVVFDSTRAGPLGGSVVEMVDAKDPLRIWRTTSSARGEFSFDSLSSGTYLVSISHPRLDSLGVRTLAQGVAVKGSERARVRLAVPSPLSLVRRVCGDSVVADESGYIRGVIRDAERTSVAVEGSVELRWLDMTVEGTAVRRQMNTVRGKADSEGNFVVCGVPREGIVQVQAWSGRDSSGVIDVTIPSDGVAVRDMYVGRFRTEAVTIEASASAATDSAGTFSTRVRRGDAQLRGSVRRDNGAPLSGVLLSVRGTGVEQRSDANGRFVLAGLPTGTYTAEIRAIGYSPVRQVVNVMPDDGATLDVKLDNAAKLDTIRIMAKRGTLGLARFDQARRATGLGWAITPEQLDRDQPLRMADMFRLIPGIRVIPGLFGDQILMRGAVTNAFCTPQVWIDGVPAMGDAPLDLLLTPEQVVGAIAYTSVVSTPAQYSTPLGGCGTILLFTGDRQAAKRK